MVVAVKMQGSAQGNEESDAVGSLPRRAVDQHGDAAVDAEERARLARLSEKAMKLVLGLDEMFGEEGRKGEEGIGELAAQVGAQEPDTCNTETDAVPRLEVLSDDAMKAVFRVTNVEVVAAGGLLLALLAINMSREIDGVKETLLVVELNAAVGAFDVMILSACLAVFLKRLWVLRAAGLRWSARRVRWTAVFLVQLVAVCVGNLAFVVSNMYVLVAKCGYYDDLVIYGACARCMAWNTLLAMFVIQARSYNLMVDRLGHPLGSQEDGTYLDAPWSSHWFVGVYWLAFQTCIGFLTYRLKMEMGGQSCMGGSEMCDINRGRLEHLGPAVVALSIGYLVMFAFYMRRAFVLFAKKSYVQFRWANVSARLTFRLVGVVLFFGVLSFAFVWFIKSSPCLGYVTAILGFVPLELALSLFMAVNTALTLPVKPGSNRTIRTLPCVSFWLEKYADQYKQEVRDRAGTGFKPLFCFETAVKLVYWCEFMYQYDPKTRQAKAPYNLETGLSLYCLWQCEYMSAKTVDAHVMIAWSKCGTILVCFRGTKSTRNLVADLKFWRTPHPPIRGYSMLGTRPMVHKGFYQSWDSEGFVHRVINKVKEIMADRHFDRGNLKVLVSGHSLGGAVAVLAAHDIRRYCGVAGHEVSCYTFGCPRVGNHRFATEHNESVPDTWHIINDLDAVPRVPKFWMMFKRSGQRVIINAQGDMIVSPIFLEFKMSSAFIGNMNMAQHKLGSYRKSLSAVALAQFHRYKALPGGSNAMRELFDKGHITDVLGVSSKSADKLEHMASKIWTQRSPYVVVGGSEDGKIGQPLEKIGECGDEGPSMPRLRPGVPRPPSTCGTVSLEDDTARV